MRFSSFSVIVVFAALMLVGLALSFRLGIQLHPESDMPVFSISYAWPDASAIQIEREVTSKLEAAVSLIRDVEQISSFSTAGFARINIQFKKTIDTEMVHFELVSLIRRMTPNLPNGVAYPTVYQNHRLAAQNKLLVFSLVTPESPYAVNQYLNSHILPKIAHIDGVDEVIFAGANDLEYRIIYDASKIKLMQLSAKDIGAAVQQNFKENFVGMTQWGNESDIDHFSAIPISIKADNRRRTAWEHIPITVLDGQIIYLNDIADVLLVEREPAHYYRINGQQAMLITINTESGVNRIKLASRIKKMMSYLQESMPHEWKVELTYDDTQLLRRDLSRVGLRMLFSLSVLLLFVLITSRNMRYTMLILLIILSNMLISIGLYYFFDIGIHMYSLAGITISFGIIVDNGIVMMAHLRHHKNKQVFLAILAATLTSAGSLAVIFMLSPMQQAQLGDFSAVVLVNITVSLFVAWFFIPALYDGNMHHKDLESIGSRRMFRKTYRYHRASMLFASRFRWVFFIILLIIFGLPVHLLPDRLTGQSAAVQAYNRTIGSKFYRDGLKPLTDQILGGSLRLFSLFVVERSHFAGPERTRLTINAGMPDGANIHQLNKAVVQIENYLKTYDGIEQFQTSVLSYNNASINVLFKPAFDDDVFPHDLERQLVKKVLSIGGVNWNISGIGRGYSNAKLHNTSKLSVALEGHNYDQLYQIALALKDSFARNPRITNLVISGGERWMAPSNRINYFMESNPVIASLYQKNIPKLIDNIAGGNNLLQTQIFSENNSYRYVHILPDDYGSLCVWGMQQTMFQTNDYALRTAGFLSVNKRQQGNDIYKNNQQYRLMLHFDFTGPYGLMEKMTAQLLAETNASLPVGYRIFIEEWDFQQHRKRDYLLILLVIVIIYILCAILLESLFQPLAVIAIIPVSFIGLFLTFYLFDLNFDQGGLAAFILLSGLSVNASLYILNDFNIFRKKRPNDDRLALYLKAFYYKLFPVTLTIASTITGLLPFLFGKKEVFWFAFAAGTIGGLVFSIIALCLFFPIFLGLKQKSLLPPDRN